MTKGQTTVNSSQLRFALSPNFKRYPKLQLYYTENTVGQFLNREVFEKSFYS